ncbi:hypothetical protein PENSPDRAFT_220860 [Peniophora sp. CONT]|nr:hypothetical protein PENSPDRAFT_220860 [Peniophora sp. CONT]
MTRVDLSSSSIVLAHMQLPEITTPDFHDASIRIKTDRTHARRPHLSTCIHPVILLKCTLTGFSDCHRC